MTKAGLKNHGTKLKLITSNALSNTVIKGNISVRSRQSSRKHLVCIDSQHSEKGDEIALRPV